MAKSLKAKFIIQDGYSRVLERFERVTKKFTEQAEKASRKTDQLEQKIKGFGQRVTSIWNKLTGLWNGSSYSGIFKMVKAFMALKAVQLIVGKIVDGMKQMDQYMNTLSRLKLINDGTHTNEQFNDKIFAAANRSKGSYQGMAESVAKMGMLAKNRFSSNDELIGFTELVQKSFRLGGADTTAQQSAMLQLSQAMASGRLQGDEYVSILENAPLIAKAIADYTGVGEEGLKKLSSEGLITADVVKNAVFSMSKDINSEFEKLPNLWGDYWNRITNETTRAFGKVMNTVSTLINTEQFKAFIDWIVECIYVVAGATNWLLESVTSGISWMTGLISMGIDWVVEKITSMFTWFATTEEFQPFIQNVMEIFYTIVGGIIGVIQMTGTVISWLFNQVSLAIAWVSDTVSSTIGWLADFIVSNWDLISSILWACLIVGIILLVQYLWTAIPPILAMVGGWLLQAVAITFVKAKLLASLIPAILKTVATWFLAHAPVILLIVLIAGLIFIAKKMGLTFGDVVGGIASLFAIFFAYIANRVIFIRNLWANLANFFSNMFKDPVQSVKILFYDMANTILGYIRNVAQGIEDLLNKIPGVEVTITSYIDDVMAKLEKVSNQAKEEMGWEELIEQKDYYDYGEVAKEWYEKSKSYTDKLTGKIGDTMSVFFGGLGDKAKDIFQNMGGKTQSLLGQFNGLSNNPYENKDLSKEFGKSLKPYIPGSGTGKPQKVKGIGRNGAIKVEMDKEDVKFLRDMAERDFVANIRHKTLAPNININFTGPISKETDTDKLYKRITKILKTQIAMAGEN